MYAISDISTFYCPKANEYRAAEKEVSEFADKLAKEKGYTNYKVWTLKVCEYQLLCNKLGIENKLNIGQEIEK